MTTNSDKSNNQMFVCTVVALLSLGIVGYSFWWRYLGGQPAVFQSAIIWVDENKQDISEIILELQLEDVEVRAWSSHGGVVMIDDRGHVPMNDDIIDEVRSKLLELGPPVRIVYFRSSALD